MKNISTVRFDNLNEMVEALRTLDGDARAMNHGQSNHNIVYVVGPDDTLFDRAVLQERTLTDGSKVYNVLLRSSKPIQS